jgi:Fic/DOC family protein
MHLRRNPGLLQGNEVSQSIVYAVDVIILGLQQKCRRRPDGNAQVGIQRKIRVRNRLMFQMRNHKFLRALCGGYLSGASVFARGGMGCQAIRQSRHVPLNREAVRDAMPAFFDLLRNENDPGVRVVLGHFVFVYIHPYMDGNGRIGRFLMNLMMAAGGYPWTVIPVAARKSYMDALEAASVGEDIGPFANFIAGLVKKRLAGAPLPEVPRPS